MPIGIDDLDFYEEESKEFLTPEDNTPSAEPPVNEEKPKDNDNDNNGNPPAQPNGGTQEEATEDEIINTLLREKGINDPSKIKFEGDNEQVEERAWKDLTSEEKLNILRQSTVEEHEDNDLTDDEIDFLNELRKNNLTPQQYISQLRDSMVSEPEPAYTVDELTDDDLYVLDLQARVEGITEEQLQKSLENAKQDEALFAKQMEGIRKEYKDLEDQNRQQQELLAQQQQEEQFNQFAQTISEQIDNLNTIGGLDVELEQDDKEELAAFILGRDEAGVSNLGKALNDPESLVLMAWYALNGDRMIDDITTMYKDAIKKARQDAYSKGLEDGKKGIQPGHVVVTPPPTKEEKKHISSVDDLDF